MIYDTDDVDIITSQGCSRMAIYSFPLLSQWEVVFPLMKKIDATLFICLTLIMMIRVPPKLNWKTLIKVKTGKIIFFILLMPIFSLIRLLKYPFSSSERHLQTQTRAEIKFYDMPKPHELHWISLTFLWITCCKRKSQATKAFNRENGFIKFVL